MASKTGMGTMPDGSYPITNQHQADSAWKLRGHSKSYSEAQIIDHIKSRVSQLGLHMPSSANDGDE